ncbi:hypothetical protein MMC30_006478 [Trapelia coarctata]|nr:hypothetical protein [Trapelia coarctata]
MPPKVAQVNDIHAQAAADTHSSPKSGLPASKKRTAASLESPRLSKQRRVGKSEAQVDSPSVLQDSTSEVRMSRRTKAAPAQPAPLDEDDEDEQTTPRDKRARGNKAATGVVTQEAAITESPITVKKTTATIVKEEEVEALNSPKGSRKSKKAGPAVAIKEEEVDVAESPKKSRKVKKTEVTALLKEEDVVAADDAPKKVKRHRKTKEEKEAEAMPLAARTNGLRMFIGAHVSGAKGVHNSITNAVHIGGNSFALFLKSQRKWENPPLQDEHRDQFLANCKEHKYEAAKHILPHGSYLVNLAQEGPDKAKQAYDAFLDDLKRCEALGIKLYNFHPGNTGLNPRPEAISRIAKALNKAHSETKTVKPLLENMAGKGNVIGATFEDLRDIIEQVEDKSRIGVCIDTCHSFAAGYDLRTPEAFKDTLDKFDNIVGMKYLSALHINDSKAPFTSHRDLHQNIGLGFLGLRAFHNVMNEPQFEGLPLVLETPIDSKNAEGKVVEDKNIWATEIKLLESLIGMDPEGGEFKRMEAELAGRGAEERKKLQDQFERKQEKDRKAVEKGKGKGKGKSKRNKKGEDEDSLSSLGDISD